MQMKTKIVVVDSDETQCGEICALLDERKYHATPVYSLANLKKCIQDTEWLVVIMDLDTIQIDNRAIRDLTLKYPGLYLLCLSSNRFHPHLKEALCYHIYACINKPIDPDELFYWLRSIYENESDPKNHPQA